MEHRLVKRFAILLQVTSDLVHDVHTTMSIRPLSLVLRQEA